MEGQVLILFTFLKDYSAALLGGWIVGVNRTGRSRKNRDNGGLNQGNMRTDRSDSSYFGGGRG